MKIETLGARSRLYRRRFLQVNTHLNSYLVRSRRDLHDTELCTDLMESRLVEEVSDLKTFN